MISYYLQLVMAVMLIVVVVVFAVRKNNKKRAFTKDRKVRKKELRHQSSGLTMDDHYRLEKAQQERELDGLLEKVSQKGMESLSQKEKHRLNELSKTL